MTNEVTVRVTSVQTDADGNRETVEQTAIGQYIEKNGKAYLSYAEESETGTSGKVTLKMEPKEVLMLRHGAYPTRLAFRTGEVNPGIYHTPYGKLNIATHTHRMEYSAGLSGRIQAEYTLLMEDSPVMRTALRVTWEERISR